MVSFIKKEDYPKLRDYFSKIHESTLEVIEDAPEFVKLLFILYQAEMYFGTRDIKLPWNENNFWDILSSCNIEFNRDLAWKELIEQKEEKGRLAICKGYTFSVKPYTYRDGGFLVRVVTETRDFIYLTLTGKKLIRQHLPNALHSFDCEFIHDGELLAQDRITELLKQSTGVIRILDIYIGSGSVNFLKSIREREIKFFVVNYDPLKRLSHDEKQSIENFVKVIEKEGDVKNKFSIEIRKKSRNQDQKQHDRYILINEGLFLIGHGLKDIGRSGSFMTYVPRFFKPDLFDQAEKIFNDFWNKSDFL